MPHRTTQADAVGPAIRPIGARQPTVSQAELHDRRRHRSAPEEGVERLLLTVSEAAGMLGIGRSLLYDLLTAGQVESIHVGRLRRIPTEALAAYIDRQRCSNPGPEG